MAKTLSINYIRKIFAYDQEAGLLRWKIQRGRRGKVDAVAGSLSPDGYWVVVIDNRIFKAHRVIWALMTGQWPSEDLDHINGNRVDNRWVNLREATRTENNANSKSRIDNTSGFKGVHYHESSGKWRARIGVDGKKKSLGLFVTPEEAHAAYSAASKELFGEFARAA